MQDRTSRAQTLRTLAVILPMSDTCQTKKYQKPTTLITFHYREKVSTHFLEHLQISLLVCQSVRTAYDGIFSNRGTNSDGRLCPKSISFWFLSLKLANSCQKCQWCTKSTFTWHANHFYEVSMFHCISQCNLFSFVCVCVTSRAMK